MFNLVVSLSQPNVDMHAAKASDFILEVYFDYKHTK